MLLLAANGNAIAAFILGSSALGLSVLYASVKRYGLEKRPSLQSILLHPVELVKKRFDAWRYLVDAPRMIQEGYDKSDGGVFTVHGPDVAHTFVASTKFIKEIAAAPDTVLSLQAAAKQVLQPQYSMHKFDWYEQRGIDGTPLVRTLRSKLTNNLPAILPKTRLANSAILDDMFATKKNPCLNELARAAVSHTNALAFFGKDLAHNEEFMKAAMDFIDKTVIIAEVVRLLPSFIAPQVGAFMANLFTSHKVFYATLLPIAEQRIAEREQAMLGHKVPEHRDCIQWVMEQSCKPMPWTAGRIVHELMALWFGAVHAMAMSISFAVHDLALHPEYVEPLRKEFEGPAYQAFEASGTGLPLLDSFLKESARLSPLDNLSTRRKALQPFELSDGTRIERGQWVCTASRAMMKDPRNFVRPLEFHGFRHADPTALALLQPGSFESPQPEKARPMVDASLLEWQVWGTGRMACPGRFYAVAGIKQIFGLILTKFDCELVDRDAPRCISWRNCNLPRSSTFLVLRQRRGSK